MQPPCRPALGVNEQPEAGPREHHFGCSAAHLHIITMSTEEPIVEPPAAAAEPEAQGDGAEASKPALPKLPPGVRVAKPVRPEDTEIKAQVDALQQSSEWQRPRVG